MKSLFTLLAASLMLAPIPIVAATHTGCHTHAPQEGIEHPLEKGRYFMLSTETRKIGEWTEGNGIAGLQTEDCFYGTTGVMMYTRDRPSTVLP